MLRILIEMRWISIIAIICSLLGALLMFIVGAAHTIEAFGVYFGLLDSHIFGGEKLLGVDVMVQLVSALDSFIFALVLFYFAFGIYHLFLEPDSSDQANAELKAKLPKWLNVTSLGQLKKSLLEVIIVLVAVLFLKEVLYLQKGTELQWTVLIAPAATIAFALALKLARFEEH